MQFSVLIFLKQRFFLKMQLFYNSLEPNHPPIVLFAWFQGLRVRRKPSLRSKLRGLSL